MSNSQYPAGKVQQRGGIAREDAERQLDGFSRMP